MILFFIILLLCVSKTKSIGKYCEISEKFQSERCYVKETLLTLTHNPNQLTVDRNTNHLYFSFDPGSGEYLAAVYKIDKKELTVLKGIKDAFAITTDQYSDFIYFGGSHGLYKYEPQKNSLKRLNTNSLDVWWLFVKNNVIYFIKFPSLNTYYYDNKSIHILNELKNKFVHQMVFDFNDHLYFINNTGLYGVKERGIEPVLLKDNTRFLNMAIDNNGHVYVCADDGIYMIRSVVQSVVKVMNIKGVLGFTFDKSNNIIYSDSHDIVRLIPV